MKRIAILSSSVRDGRLSHRVALSLRKYLIEEGIADVELLDLKAYDFPLFHERLRFQKEPPGKVRDFASRFTDTDGVIIVTPVYNGSYPAALKNVIDLLFAEWRHKPVGIVSVTDGSTPGIATIQQIQTILLKMNALIAPVLCTALMAGNFSEDGSAAEAEFAKPLIKELLFLLDRMAPMP